MYHVLSGQQIREKIANLLYCAQIEQAKLLASWADFSSCTSDSLQVGQSSNPLTSENLKFSDETPSLFLIIMF